MKPHIKISFFGFHLNETHVQRKWSLDFRHFILQKKTKLNKKHLSAILTKNKKCTVFTFVQYIISFRKSFSYKMLFTFHLFVT